MESNCVLSSSREADSVSKIEAEFGAGAMNFASALSFFQRWFLVFPRTTLNLVSGVTIVSG
jgi:hypothetical protein